MENETDKNQDVLLKGRGGILSEHEWIQLGHMTS
jgi:hypothetical protein